jgi:hypothetical protein
MLVLSPKVPTGSIGHLQVRLSALLRSTFWPFLPGMLAGFRAEAIESICPAMCGATEGQTNFTPTNLARFQITSQLRSGRPFLASTKFFG